MTVNIWWVPVSFVMGAWFGLILMGIVACARIREIERRIP